MNIKGYEKFVKDGASPNYDTKLAIIGLVGEVGELADVVKKECIYDDMSKFVSKYGMSVRDKVIDEAGDVLWQLTLLISLYGVDFNTVMNNNVKKLLERHNGTKVSADGGNR